MNYPKRILYLSFYFEPDLCAGSFRNSPLAKELARQAGSDVEVVVITTQPNRYNSYKVEAPQMESQGNLTIHRVSIPTHQSGFKDQINSFRTYYQAARKLVARENFDLVFASSSRLFTAYLGYRVARLKGLPLYLDVRDIFVDTMADVLPNPLLRKLVLPVLRYVEKKTFAKAKHINLISGGFKSYFAKYPNPEYTNFPNGIDDVFLDIPASDKDSSDGTKTIVYAGNIGEGQGLHRIVPETAKRLGDEYRFLIVGDGGARAKLEDALEQAGVTNVSLKEPVKRDELLQLYAQAHFLFIHLNDYEAFKKVLPSKVFELGAYDKPIIAGVGGFANQFIQDHLSNVILFLPGDVDSMVNQLEHYHYKTEFRKDFVETFKRSAINKEMATSILNYLQ